MMLSNAGTGKKPRQSWNGTFIGPNVTGSEENSIIYTWITIRRSTTLGTISN